MVLGALQMFATKGKHVGMGSSCALPERSLWIVADRGVVDHHLQPSLLVSYPAYRAENLHHTASARSSVTVK